jgi:toxin ParE1/3/4
VARILWTAEAIADLEAIRDFIAEASPHYGNVMAARLVEAIDHLGQFPRAGRVVPELQREDIREVIHGTYRIVYQVHDPDDVVEVLTVFRASRELPEL